MEVPEESFHWSSWDSRTCYPRRAFIQGLTDDCLSGFAVNFLMAAVRMEGRSEAVLLVGFNKSSERISFLSLVKKKGVKVINGIKIRKSDFYGQNFFPRKKASATF